MLVPVLSVSLFCHPPGWHKGVNLVGCLPCQRYKMGGCLFSNGPEHRAEDSASHAPPSLDPPGWVRTHHLPGQLERCLSEQVPEAAASSRQAAELPLLGHKGCTAGLATFPPTPVLEKSKSAGPGGSLSMYLTPQPGQGLENPNPNGCLFLS